MLCTLITLAMWHAWADAAPPGLIWRAQVAPSVPCTLITPIAPHTLSFRPVVVPEASDIVVHLSESSRAHARRACIFCMLSAPD